MAQQTLPREPHRMAICRHAMLQCPWDGPLDDARLQTERQCG
jgi:hypothetical protein